MFCFGNYYVIMIDLIYSICNIFIYHFTNAIFVVVLTLPIGHVFCFVLFPWFSWSSWWRATPPPSLISADLQTASHIRFYLFIYSLLAASVCGSGPGWEEGCAECWTSDCPESRRSGVVQKFSLRCLLESCISPPVCLWRPSAGQLPPPGSHCSWLLPPSSKRFLDQTVEIVGFHSDDEASRIHPFRFPLLPGALN